MSFQSHSSLISRVSPAIVSKSVVLCVTSRRGVVEPDCFLPVLVRRILFEFSVRN